MDTNFEAPQTRLYLLTNVYEQAAIAHKKPSFEGFMEWLENKLTKSK